MNSGVTLKDLARELDLSIATVSKALRGLPGVQPETAARICQLAEARGYEPNSIAQSLVQQRTHTLGVMIPAFTIPFYAEAISGMQTEANRLGYSLLVCQSNEDFEQEQANLRTLLRSRVDGMIVSLSRESPDTSHLGVLRDKAIPYVLFNRMFADDHASGVHVDDAHGAEMAVEHLVAQGCRRLAHISGPGQLPMCWERQAGYLAAVQAFGVANVGIKACDFTYQGGYDAAQALLPARPDGLFVVCDTAAFGAMAAFQVAGLRIPEEVAVVGFTDERAAALVSPALTTLAQPSYEIGQLAAKLLVDHIQRPDLPPRIEQFRTELIVRNSSLRS